MNKHRYKKVIATVLACALCITASVGAYASEQMNNFAPVRTYSQGEFEDIKSGDWFYSDVISAYEYGITQGAGQNKFLPYDLVSVAEVTAFGARICSIYSADDEAFEAEDGEAWYEPFYEYALANGIIIEADGLKALANKPASRAQTAYILANSLPFTELSNLNTSISALPDVAVTDLYYNEIIMLYRAGVLSGKDEYGTFSPTENITRAEVAATVNRIIKPEARLSFELEQRTQTGQSGSASGEYGAEYVSEKASPCVFYIEIYDSKGNATASGSGFFIAADGTAVTNYHVIEDAYSAKITTVTGNTYDVSRLLGYDEDRDLAIIQVSGENFPYLEIANSDEVKNGQRIFCIGSPLGLDNSITEGVVSNVSRTIEEQEYIQISAAISHGSSGGAVLDTDGRVIGISSAGFESGQNVNLAIPSNCIGELATDKNYTLEEFQQARRGVMAAGNSYYYPENKAVPDYGYITGSTEIEGYRDAQSSSIARAYAYKSDEVLKYINEINNAGFTLVSKNQSGGFWNTTINMTFVGENRAFLAMSVDSEYVIVLYMAD